MAFLRFSCSAERRRLCCFSAVDHCAGVLLDAALAQWFMAAIAKHRVSMAAGRILAVGTRQ